MSTVCSRRDLQFLLYEMLDTTALAERERYDLHDRVSFDAALDLAFRLADEQLEPHAARADVEEPHVVDGKVVQISETTAGLAQLRDA
ncbi:MAG: acyl-CoA dehydrogenase family protein, partial [Alphaproteobacteria bacterium]|nr:acyl-CoA dehydrogenase family protein [Alphaproteobacteria bacterium]